MEIVASLLIYFMLIQVTWKEIKNAFSRNFIQHPPITSAPRLQISHLTFPTNSVPNIHFASTLAVLWTGTHCHISQSSLILVTQMSAARSLYALVPSRTQVAGNTAEAPGIAGWKAQSC